MCGRYSLVATPAEIDDLLGPLQLPLPELRPRYNISPSQSVAIVRVVEGGERELALVHWGLIPPWSKDTKTGYSLINARADGVATKPSFRRAFKKQRCLLPVTAFYEWQKVADGPKQPYCIRLRGGALGAFAGLWERWTSEDGATVVDSTTIVTTVPNDLVSNIHDRMPAVLTREHYATWLDPQEDRAETLLGLLVPYPAMGMEAYRVSSLVNRPQNEVERCLAPVEQGELF